MKATKIYPIDAEYSAIVEIDDNDLIIYIEKRKKIFLGLIDWGERVTGFTVFTMGSIDEDRGVQIERMIHGLFCRPQLGTRNIDAFEIEVEIKKIWNAYKSSEQSKKERDEKLSAFINTL